jgi:phage-related protein|tara:strand:- start:336 stop:731 length:396 start_codon:yes stop_codon:yes gene_type:complete
MALGLTQKNGSNITGFSAPVVYDRGLQQSAKPRILKAQFGDGYEMRMKDGINNTPRTWTLSFANRTKADIDDLYTFMNGLAEVDTAKLTVPDTNSSGNEDAVVVILEGYSKTLAYDDYYSLSCTAREVFEA